MLRVAEHFEGSDTGRQRRANEDSFLARAPLFVVADGMGGAQAGEVASRVAVEAFARGLEPDPDASAQELLAARVAEANGAIHELSRSAEDRAGMGTTISAVHIGEEEAAIAHVGDSRVYLLRDGRLTRLTDDHSLVEELLRQGKLTPEEAVDHPQKSIITRALGPEADVEVDRQTVRLRDGDVLLLCSDGLTTMVGERELAALVAELGPGGLAATGRELIAAANRAGGRDNITVVLVRVEDVGAPGEEASTTTHAAVTSAPGAPAAVAERPAAARRPVARRPAAAATGDGGRRRSRRWAKVTAIVLVVVTPLAIALWTATRAVYFVGTDDAGRVALFQGLPYDLPAGISLYQTNYRSGVPAAQLSAGQRERLLDHRLRSHDDAVDLVRELELGRLE